MPDLTHKQRRVCRHCWRESAWRVPTEKLEAVLKPRIKLVTFRRRLKVACRGLYLRVSSSADLMSADSLSWKNCLLQVTNQHKGGGLLRNTGDIRGVEALSVSKETYIM